MQLFMRLTLVALLLGLGACKVRIIVPEGGTVVSDSRTYILGPGERVTIDVVDYFFSETFHAEPDDGFVFLGWRKRERSLCGGKVTACRISTVEFAGDGALDPFLEGDTVFFLEPVFGPDPGSSGSGSGMASACFKTDQFVPGTVTRLTYRETESASGRFTRFRNTSRTIGRTMFEGNSALEIEAVNTPLRPADEESTINLYVDVDESAREVLTYGNRFTGEVEGFGEAMVTNENIPPVVQSFNLGPGDTYEQTYESVNTITADRAALSSRSTYSLTTRFLGLEPVTVMAGTFQTCKIVQDTETQGVLPGSTISFRLVLWIDRATGVMVRSEQEGIVTELEEGTLGSLVIQ